MGNHMFSDEREEFLLTALLEMDSISSAGCVDIVGFVEQIGFTVLQVSSAKEFRSGLLCDINESSPMFDRPFILVNKDMDPREMRHCIAKEFAYWTTFSEDPEGVFEDATVEQKTAVAANIAAAVLTPKEAFLYQVSEMVADGMSGCQLIQNLSDCFDVPEQVIIWRGKDLHVSKISQ